MKSLNWTGLVELGYPVRSVAYWTLDQIELDYGLEQTPVFLTGQVQCPTLNEVYVRQTFLFGIEIGRFLPIICYGM